MLDQRASACKTDDSVDRDGDRRLLLNAATFNTEPHRLAEASEVTG